MIVSSCKALWGGEILGFRVGVPVREWDSKASGGDRSVLRLVEARTVDLFLGGFRC